MRLFHKEDECYIVAEGSFAESNPVVENGKYNYVFPFFFCFVIIIYFKKFTVD